MSPDGRRLVTSTEDGAAHVWDYKMRAANAAFLATESNPKGWVAATHSSGSPDVWTNPARTCHHADSGAPLAARSTARLTLKLYLLAGSAEDAWRRVAI